MILLYIFLFFLGACWGSFLNVLAWRVLHDKTLFTVRSYCPACQKTIAFYDNIPVFSWFLLRGRARCCKNSISFLYPLIEIVTGIVFVCLFLSLNPELFPQNTRYFFSYLVFFSALIAATRTDLEAMLIPQCFSLWLVPAGLLFSKIGFWQSLIGAICGYGVLWLIGWSFEKTTGKQGLGEGDMEIAALIGSFLGVEGVWISLSVGSMSGLIVGLTYLLITRQTHATKIPFAPFLALGAFSYYCYCSWFFGF
jgi:leader peptidase (prepilin peptidase)/N-methyltransferase